MSESSQFHDELQQEPLADQVAEEAEETSEIEQAGDAGDLADAEGAEDAASLDHAAEVVRTHLTNHRITASDAMTFSERMAVRRDEVKAAEAARAAATMADDEGEAQLDYPKEQR